MSFWCISTITSHICWVFSYMRLFLLFNYYFFFVLIYFRRSFSSSFFNKVNFDFMFWNLLFGLNSFNLFLKFNKFSFMINCCYCMIYNLEIFLKSRSRTRRRLSLSYHKLFTIVILISWSKISFVIITSSVSSNIRLSILSHVFFYWIILLLNLIHKQFHFCRLNFL